MRGEIMRQNFILSRISPLIISQPKVPYLGIYCEIGHWMKQLTGYEASVYPEINDKTNDNNIKDRSTHI